MEQYIDKSIIMAEIERLQSFFVNKRDGFEKGYHHGLDMVLSFIDSMETKEVNLEKELERLDSLLYDLDGIAIAGTTSYLTVEDVKYIAKRFFELGLKAQKGEK